MERMNTHLNAAAAEEWQLAIDLLKPSPSELERGLEIHRQSLVAESYSLGLHAPLDIPRLRAEILAGASSAEFKDLVEEQWMINWADQPSYREEYREAWQSSGVSCLFLNAGEEGNDPLRLLKRVARYTHLIDAMPDMLGRATSVDQIRANHQTGKRSICLTLNGVPLAGRQLNAEDEMSYIRLFAQLGVRMMHWTYNRRNALGDGCGEPHDGGMSDFGGVVVRELNRLGVIIDLAHTGWRTTVDVTKVTEQPVLISHSSVHSLCQNIRAKSDDVIKAVLDTGGVMGITNVPAFLGGSGDIHAFLAHIDYMVRKYGDSSVTIGTDRAYRSPGAVITSEFADIPIRSRTRWETLWPEGQHPSTAEWSKPEMLKSLSWTNWPLFTVGLVQKGYSDETIQRILGENLLRVARSVWGSAR